MRKIALAPVGAIAVKRPRHAVLRPTPWKLVGLAGIAGVAATGVVVAHNRRARSDLPPEELRERLHSRLAAVDAASDPQPPGPPA